MTDRDMGLPRAGEGTEVYITDTVGVPPTAIISEHPGDPGEAEPEPSLPEAASTNSVTGRELNVGIVGLMRTESAGAFPLRITASSLGGAAGNRRFTLERSRDGAYEATLLITTSFRALADDEVPVFKDLANAPVVFADTAVIAPVVEADGTLRLFALGPDSGTGGALRLWGLRYNQATDGADMVWANDDPPGDTAVKVYSAPLAATFQPSMVTALLAGDRIFIFVVTSATPPADGDLYVFLFEPNAPAPKIVPYAGPIANFNTGRTLVLDAGISAAWDGENAVVAVGGLLNTPTERAVLMARSPDLLNWTPDGAQTGFARLGFTPIREATISAGGTEPQPLGPVEKPFTAVAFDPANTQNGWAGTDDGRIFRTIDGARTWTEQSTPTSLLPVRIDAIALVAVSDGVYHVYAGGQSTGALGGAVLARTTNSGGTWALLSGVGFVSTQYDASMQTEGTFGTGYDLTDPNLPDQITAMVTNGTGIVWVAGRNRVTVITFTGATFAPKSEVLASFPDATLTSVGVVDAANDTILVGGRIGAPDGLTYAQFTVAHARFGGASPPVFTYVPLPADIQLATATAIAVISAGRAYIGYDSGALALFALTALPQISTVSSMLGGAVTVLDARNIAAADHLAIGVNQVIPVRSKQQPTRRTHRGAVLHSRDGGQHFVAHTVGTQGVGIVALAVFLDADTNEVIFASTAESIYLSDFTDRALPRLVGLGSPGGVVLAVDALRVGTVELWQSQSSKESVARVALGNAPAITFPPQATVTAIAGTTPWPVIFEPEDGSLIVTAGDLTFDGGFIRPRSSLASRAETRGTQWIDAKYLDVPFAPPESFFPQTAAGIAYGGLRLFLFAVATGGAPRGFVEREWDRNGTHALPVDLAHPQWLGIDDLRYTWGGLPTIGDVWTIDLRYRFSRAQLTQDSPTLYWRTQTAAGQAYFVDLLYNRADPRVVAAKGAGRLWMASAAALFNTNFPLALFAISVPDYDDPDNFPTDPNDITECLMSAVVEEGIIAFIDNANRVSDPTKNWSPQRWAPGLRQHYLMFANGTSRRILGNSRDTLLYEGAPVGGATGPYVIFTDRMVSLGQGGQRGDASQRPVPELLNTPYQFGQWLRIRIIGGLPAEGYHRIGTPRIGMQTPIVVPRREGVRERARFSRGFRWSAIANSVTERTIANIRTTRSFGRSAERWTLAYDQLEEWEREILMAGLLPDQMGAFAFIPDDRDLTSARLMQLEAGTEFTHVGGPYISHGVTLVEIP